MDPVDELFSDPPDAPPVSATIGDVINLDSVSQDSVPLDDTLSAEGVNPEADTPDEETATNRADDETTEKPTDSEGTQKAKVGSPKPFDARLFGETAEDTNTSLASDFPIEAPVPSLPSQEGDEAVNDDQVQELSNSGSLAVDVHRQTSMNGFESQPIGSPGSQFQFSDSDNPLGEASHAQSLVGPEMVTAPGGQPPISSFFEEQEVGAVGDTDAKSFFDSFTSGGDGFPGSGSIDNPPVTEDGGTAVSPSDSSELSLQPEGQVSLSAPTPDLSSSPMKGSTEEISLGNGSAETPQEPPTKQTLLELARQSSAQDSPEVTSGEQTISAHSSLTEVTSPHLCSVQEQAEGEPLKVAFTKNHTVASEPKVVDTHDTPQASPSESQATPSEPPPTNQSSPGEPKQPPAQPHTPQQPQLFAPMSPSQDGDDIFATAISTSQSDRRHDAWLPSTATQKVLANRMLALQGTEFVDRAQLTMPGIILEDPQGDPVKELVYRYMGEAEASKRVALTADQVTHDEAGLKRLLDTGCLRAAVDLTGLLLTSMGQGKGQAGMPSKHTPLSLQIWLTRIALLVKLQQYSMAEVEFEAFGNLDRPDLYFEYYPDLYAGRKGTMVPFSFRVLHAELPIYLGKHQDSLNRLYHLLDIVTQILFNLESGMSEYGTEIELTEDNRKASVDLWKSREIRVLYSVGNCLLSMKDFIQVVSVYETLLEKDAKNASTLLSGTGRIFLQLGDLKSAQEYFTRAEESFQGAEDIKSKASVLMNTAFMHMAQNQYPEARKSFDALLEIDPENFTAINNQSVCLLYMGKLKEALALLERLVQGDPTTYLDEGLLFNLCTLYELESSRSTHKKQALLEMVSQHKGDGFNIGCLKML